MADSIIGNVQAWILRKRADALPAGSLRARFVFGTFWALTGTLISQSLQLAATILVARWLGKAEYGEIGIIKSTVGMFGVFVGLGLGLTATKYVSELRAEDPARAGRIATLTLTVALISGSVVTLALILLSPWLARHTLASPAVAGPLAIGAGLLFFGEVNGVQTCILAGLEAFGTLARVSLWAGLCSFPIILAATWLWGVRGAVSGLVASLALNYLLNHLALRRETAKAGIPIAYSGFWREHAVLWSFSLPAFLSSAVVTPVAWACNAMLVNARQGYAEMGLFSAADQWRNIVLFLPGVISRVVLPILSSHSKEAAEEANPFSQTLEAGFSAGVLVAFPLVTALNFGGSLLIKAYGADFAGLRFPLAGLLYAGGLLAIGTPVGLAVQAKGAMWLGFLNNLTWSLLLLGSFRFLLVPSAWGLAQAYAFSYLVLSLTFLWFFCKAGYFPWRLGVRTSLADLSLLLFAFTPLWLPVSLSLRLSPLALALSLIAVWIFLPRNVTSKLVGASAWIRGGRMD